MAKAPEMTRITVTSGRSAVFPLPMLRFAEAWPATDDDAVKIERTIVGIRPLDGERVTIDLYTYQSDVAQHLSEKRWASFGWVVLHDDAASLPA